MQGSLTQYSLGHKNLSHNAPACRFIYSFMPPVTLVVANFPNFREEFCHVLLGEVKHQNDVVNLKNSPSSIEQRPLLSIAHNFCGPVWFQNRLLTGSLHNRGHFPEIASFAFLFCLLFFPRPLPNPDGVLKFQNKFRTKVCFLLKGHSQ